MADHSTTGLKLIPAAEAVESLIDRRGDIQAQLAQYALLIAPLKNKAESLDAQILEHFTSTPADAIVVAEGTRYSVKIGAKADEQSVVAGGLKTVFGWIGADKFIEKAKLTFEQLKGILSEQQYAQVVTKARTGRRTLSYVPKIAAGGPPLQAA